MLVITRHAVFRLIIFYFVTMFALTAFSVKESRAEQSIFDLGQLSFQSIGDNEKIPDGIVTALIQDKHGFLWIGSYGGLVRYDGYRFQLHKHQKNDSNSLSGNYVQALWSDSDGILWIGTNSDGVTAYNPQDNRYSRFLHQEDNVNSLINNTINALVGDNRGMLFVASNGGLSLIETNTGKVTRLDNIVGCPVSLRAGSIRTLLLGKNNELWIGTATGLCRLSIESLGVGNANDNTQSLMGYEFSDFNGQPVRTLFGDLDGKVWVGTRQNGAAFLSASSEKITRITHSTKETDSLSHPWVLSIAQPNADEIWLGTAGGGITIVSALDGRVIKHIRHDPANNKSINNDNVAALLADKSGLMWIGTWGAGLQMYNPGNAAFRYLGHSPYQKNSLSHSDVTVFLELENKQLWVGNRKTGVDVIEPVVGVVRGFRPDPSDQTALDDGNIVTMAQTRNGSTWVGTRSNGLFRYDKANDIFLKQKIGDVKLSIQVRSLLETPEGHLWVGTSSGIALLDIASEELLSLSYINNIDKLTNKSIHVLVYHEKLLWIGTNQGLFVVSMEEKKLTEISSAAGSTSSLSNNYIAGLLVDSRGRLLVGTAIGLDRLINYDGQHAEFESIDDIVNRPGQSSGNLMEDNQGRIWTVSGWIDPENRTYEQLDAQDGFYVGTNWLGSFTKMRDGTLLYGGTEGIMMVRPERLQPWNYQPPLVVTELRVNNKKIPVADSMTLPAATNSLSVEFAALDFTASEKLQYAYKLEGFDDDWIATDANNRRATYTNLPPDVYHLRIKGSNRKGDWSKHQIDLVITQVPSWNETWWFKTLIAVLFILTMYLIFQLRVRQLKQKEKALEAQVADRTLELQSSNKQLAGAFHELKETHEKLEETHGNLKQAQGQLVLSEKMAGLGTLTAGVAHEINNPTNFAHNAVFLMQEEIDNIQAFLIRLAGGSAADPKVIGTITEQFDKLTELTKTASEGTKRIKKIVENLCSFTRLDSDDRQVVSVIEPISSTLNLIRTQYHFVTFNTEFNTSRAINGFPAKLSQVFMNIIVNGCQAIAERQKQEPNLSGEILIKTFDQDNQLVVEISDNGIGMSEATLLRVFEPFFTTKAVGSGTGLGMSICYGIVEEHGGQIQIQSFVGNGTTVKLYFNFE